MSKSPRLLFAPHLLALSLAGGSSVALAQEATAPDTEDQDTKAEALDAVTIFGSRYALERSVGSAHQLDETQLETYRYDDIQRVLNSVPGIYLRGEDGFGLRPNIGLRGGNSDRSQKVTLMEDGVLFGPAPYAAPAAYYFPLSARMDGVEVYKGPAAIQFGPQTIGGAINLRSAPIPDLNSARIDLAGGSDGYRRLDLRGGGYAGNLGLSSELLHVGSDGFKQLDGGGDTGFDKTEWVSKLGMPLGNGQFELRLDLAEEGSDETYLGLTEADFRANPLRRYRGSALDRMDWERVGVRADFQHALAGGYLHLVGYHHDFSRAWRKFNNFRGADIRTVLANPNSPGNRPFYEVLTGISDSDGTASNDDLLIGTNDRDFRSSGLQASWRSQIRQNVAGNQWLHQLEIGSRLHADRVTRLHDEFAFEMIGGELQQNGAARTITADNTGRAEALALWLVDAIEINRLTLAPGLRVEAVQTEFVDRRADLRNSNRTLVVLPGIGANYAFSDRWNVLAGVHRGFSPPSPGATDTDPEDAINYELGLRFNKGAGSNGGLRAELIGFYSDYRNLTAVCTFSSGCDDAALGQQTNAGAVETVGIESLLELDWRLGDAFSAGIDISYTWTRGEFDESFQSSNPQFSNVEAGFELPYLPEHRAHAAFELSHPLGSVALSVSHLSAMRDTAGRGEIAADEGSDAHTVLDLSARAPLTRELGLFARIDNLLDEEYVVSRRPFGARPGKPLTAILGLRWDVWPG